MALPESLTRDHVTLCFAISAWKVSDATCRERLSAEDQERLNTLYKHCYVCVRDENRLVLTHKGKDLLLKASDMMSAHR